MNAPDLHVSVIVLNYRNVADTVSSACARVTSGGGRFSLSVGIGRQDARRTVKQAYTRSDY